MNDLMRLRQEAAKYRMLLSETTEPAFACCVDLRITYMNRATNALARPEADGLLGSPACALFQESEHIAFYEASSLALTGEAVQVELKAKRGSRAFNFRIRPLFEPSGNVGGLLAVGNDMAAHSIEELLQRRTAELIEANELILKVIGSRQRAEEACNTLLELCSEAVISIDAQEGSILCASGAAAALLGRQAHELKGSNACDLHPAGNSGILAAP